MYIHTYCVKERYIPFLSDLFLTNILKVIIIVIGTVRIGDGGQKIIGDPERVVEIRDILRNTLVQDPDDRKVVSFSVQGTSGIYKIKFNSAKQAELFIEKVTRYSTVPC